MRFLVLLTALLLLSACGDDGAYVVSDLTLERSGWDSLHVAASFGHRSQFWGLRPAGADTAEMLIIDSRYDTLYAGPLGWAALPDERLADREKLLVEVCGELNAQTVCRQQSLLASPKRLDVEADIRYPMSGAVEAGMYEVDIAVERKRWREEDWEVIDPGEALTAYFKASVEGQGDGDTVRVPLDPPSGAFVLARQARYDDFIFQLNSSLYEKRRARVTFKVFAGINGYTEHVATIQREVRSQTRGEQMDAVWGLVRAAARGLVERLADEDADDIRVYIDDWSYNGIIRRYTIDIELQWEEGRSFFRDDDFSLKGTLQVATGGGDARFEYIDGNRSARERWEEEIDEPVIPLPPLDIEPRLPQDEEHENLREVDFSPARRQPPAAN